MKSGFVSLLGRPNSGKSTLLNRLVGEKVSIVTPKPQTTRNVVRGIVHRPEGQIVFLDTPGIHKPGHRLNQRMMQFVHEALRSVDLLLLLVDASTPFGHGDEFAANLIKGVGLPKFLLLNKTDAIQKETLLPLIDRYAKLVDFAEVIPISALTGDNVDALLAEIFRRLSEGPQYYPEDQITDQPERFLVAEIVREQLILETREELPYSTAVAIDQFREEDKLIRISATIYVERDSQKGIVIGKGGQLLKRVGTGARRDIESLLHSKVFLELFVKVKKNWRDDETVLNGIGM